MKLNINKDPAKILRKATATAVARAAEVAHDAEYAALDNEVPFDDADWALTFLAALQADGFAVVEARPGRQGFEGAVGAQGAQGMTGPQGPQGRPLGFLNTQIASAALMGGGI